MLQEMGSNLVSKSVILLAAGLAICAGLSLSVAQAQISAPKLGGAAPEIKLAKILQAPDGATTDWKSLKGKVVVVEFWATWCSPCMPAITHLNELAEKFKDQPVQFISITDEDEATITQFLKQKPIRGWVGLDTEGAASKVYQPRVIPHTVIIGRDGRIAAITEPKNVTAEAISDLLAGKRIEASLKESITADLDWDKKEEAKTDTKTEAATEAGPVLQIIIKSSQAASGGTSVGPGKITGDGMVFLNFITTAYRTRLHWIINHIPESKEVYKVSVVMPKGREEAIYPVYQQAVEAFFGIRTRREIREVDAFALQRARQRACALLRRQKRKPGLGAAGFTPKNNA
jgi:thiol-disulfide isomerase/thioredoxin